jgi:hypothetical protein
MTNQPLQDSWLDFYRSVSAVGAPDLQTEEMRVTFFCGAVALYSLITKQLGAPASPSSTKAMQAIHDEIGAFMKQVNGVRLDS